MSALNHTYPFGFSPQEEAEDGWASAIFASQFPERCEKLLLVEDDLTRQGLGFTATFWAAALLVAVRVGRVLIEVPLNNTWPHPSIGQNISTIATSPALAARWCGVPPYTLQCFYAEWSHCTPPDDVFHEAPQTRHRRKDGDPKYPLLKKLPHEPRALRMKLSWFKV